MINGTILKMVLWTKSHYLSMIENKTVFFQPGYLGKFSLKSSMQYPIEPNKRLVGINLTVGLFRT